MCIRDSGKAATRAGMAAVGKRKTRNTDQPPSPTAARLPTNSSGAEATATTAPAAAQAIRNAPGSRRNTGTAQATALTAAMTCRIDPLTPNITVTVTSGHRHTTAANAACTRALVGTTAMNPPCTHSFEHVQT